MSKTTPKEDMAYDAARAAALVKSTAESTATALYIQQIQKDILEIKASIVKLTDRDDSYVHKEEFVFWRNLLVSGMVLSIFTAVIINLFVK